MPDKPRFFRLDEDGNPIEVDEVIGRNTPFPVLAHDTVGKHLAVMTLFVGRNGISYGTWAVFLPPLDDQDPLIDQASDTREEALETHARVLQRIQEYVRGHPPPESA